MKRRAVRFVCAVMGVLAVTFAGAAPQDGAGEEGGASGSDDIVKQLRADLERQTEQLRDEIAEFRQANAELAELRQQLRDDREAVRAKSAEYDHQHKAWEAKREQEDLDIRRGRNEMERQRSRLESLYANLWGDAPLPEGRTLVQAIADERDDARAEVIEAHRRIEALEATVTKHGRTGAASTARPPASHADLSDIMTWNNLLGDPQTAAMVGLSLSMQCLKPAERLPVLERVRENDSAAPAVRRYASVLLIRTASELDRGDIVESLLMELISTRNEKPGPEAAEVEGESASEAGVDD